MINTTKNMSLLQDGAHMPNRVLRLQGSRKIGDTCGAKIVVKIYQSGEFLYKNHEIF